ncbi:MAG: oligoendopeptidase F, partial [Staphylococcus lugdunensis]|nr:oligoendopeptidase F [Staphylococcus lugdunensis]
MPIGLPLRKDVPTNETWDLQDLFKSDDDFYNTLAETTKRAKHFQQSFKSQLTNTQLTLKALDEYENILITIDRLANYVELRLSVDTTDEEGQKVNAKFSTSMGLIASQLSFVESELLALSDNQIRTIQANVPYPHYIEKLIQRKSYQLSPAVEETLATLSPLFSSAYDLYGTTKMLDVHFHPFEHDGITYPLDYATFENEYEDHPDPNFRQQSFKHFSDALRQYQHTTAATYNMQVQQEKIEATLRGYDSVIDFL